MTHSSVNARWTSSLGSMSLIMIQLQVLSLPLVPLSFSICPRLAVL
jgi:hypothetical protein